MMLAPDPGPDGNKRMGNDKFEGYCVDLLHEISKILKVCMYDVKYLYCIPVRLWLCDTVVVQDD